METFLGLIVLASVVVVGWLVRHYAPTYIGEKGKNLATKEDIAAITREIEDVKNVYVAEAEQLRTTLRISAHAAETRFLKYHEKRAEAIDGLYKRIVRAQAAFEPLTGGIISADEDPEERFPRAATAGNDLLTFFREHRLYFDSPIVDHFGRLEAILHEAWITYALGRREDWSGSTREERQVRVDAVNKSFKAIREDAPALLRELEFVMREILAGSSLSGSTTT